MKELLFNYIFQHEETGRMFSKVYSLEEIEDGAVLKDKIDLKRHTIVARRLCSTVQDMSGYYIYEGDILEEAAPRGYVFLVEFENGLFVKRQISRKHPGVSSNLNDSIRHLELYYKGNRYENPELMNI